MPASPWQLQGLYVYNMDSFVMFNANLPKDHLDYVLALASPDFQPAFNRAKGSIPVRRELSLADFNPLRPAVAHRL